MTEHSFPIQKHAPCAVALGNFDGVHAGHAALIALGAARAKERGLPLVALTFLPETLPHPPALLSGKEEREALLLAAGADEVVFLPFDEVRTMSPEDFVREILIARFDAMLAVTGFNYRFGYRAAGDAALLCRLLREAGRDAAIADAVLYGGAPVSSSRIREALANGEVDAASAMLRRPVSWSLPVLHGKALGRTLGFPTVNQAPPAGHALPRRGVWVSEVNIGGVRYPALTNVGVRPTVDAHGTVDFETWIRGYHGDLYGKTLTVTLKKFLRDERRFSSEEELKKQIEVDKNAIDS